jgi:N-alpha-acetyltransferase 10/11
MQVRRATMDDMYNMQHTNLRCLPENYNLRYYLYHILSWPQLLYVSEDMNKKTVGYVLAKMDDEEDAAKAHGHITSLAVLRTHRKLGVASAVMRATMREMDNEYQANFCSLHVRKTNDAALHLYQETLGYRCAEIDEKYYVDDEDAFHMKKYFRGKQPPLFYVKEDKTLMKQAAAAVLTPGGAAADAHVDPTLSNGNATAAPQQKKGKGKK